MQNKRCFLCGHKMAENGLCTNAECIRSQSVAENKNSEKEAPATAAKTAKKQAQSGTGALKSTFKN